MYLCVVRVDHWKDDFAESLHDMCARIDIGAEVCSFDSGEGDERLWNLYKSAQKVIKDPKEQGCDEELDE